MQASVASAGADPPGSPAGSAGGSGADVRVEGLCKGTVLKREGDMGGGTVRVHDCHEAVVYLLAPARYVSVVGCSDCTVFVGAAGQSVRVEQCERVTVIAAAVRIQLRSCRDSVLYLGVNRPPLLLGDNRNLRLAPYNTFYDRLKQDMATAGVCTAPNLWDKPATLTALQPEDSSKVVSPLPPGEYLPFIVPFRRAPPLGDAAGETGATNANPFMVPLVYASALDDTVKRVMSLRAAVRDAALEESRRRELQATVQAFFKEWLVSTGQMRQVYDLLRMERAESGTPAATQVGLESD